MAYVPHIRIRTKAGIRKQPEMVKEALAKGKAQGCFLGPTVLAGQSIDEVYFPWHPNPKSQQKLHSVCCQRAEEGSGELVTWSRLRTQTKNKVPSDSILNLQKLSPPFLFFPVSKA